MNVSSIIVKTTTEHLQRVMEAINALDSCEVHFHDPAGMIVATIEGETVDEQIVRMKKIQGIPFVYSANLSYSYCGDELTTVFDKIKDKHDPVPEDLKEL